MRIGHRAINLGLPMFEAIDKAAEIGFEGITLMVREGWIEPKQAQADGCAEVRQRIEDNGLELSALTGSFGSIADAEAGDVARDRAVTVVQTAAAMGVDLVTSHIGVISEDLDCEDMKLMLERVGVVCEVADDVDVTVCVETGPEECWVLRDFIERLGSPRLRVNYDPANLVMKGFDHVQGVYDLAPYIVHTHAKDGLRDPGDRKRQQPLGEGDVDIPRWVGQLREIGYDGWLCIERESGEDKIGDAISGLALLRSLIE